MKILSFFYLAQVENSNTALKVVLTCLSSSPKNFKNQVRENQRVALHASFCVLCRLITNSHTSRTSVHSHHNIPIPSSFHQLTLTKSHILIILVLAGTNIFAMKPNT